MSYARFVEGDVYVFPSSSGIECLDCILPGDLCVLTGFVMQNRWVAKGDTFREQVVHTLVHLAQHERAGHRVPNRAWDMLHTDLLTGELA